ncbi:DUF4956 domain-containing protein [candidate division KSB1 bacterium]|nr:DUF4956 domain-containing protein [candidate division KSB1 bacterium]
MQTNPFEGLFTIVPDLMVADVIINMITAFILGFSISVLYRVSNNGYSYSPSFVNTLVIITMVTSIVIMVIGNNLARAFGLVGAMSIIRFRTALKDTRDIVFVFFSLAAGMAAGAGNYLIGLVGSSIVGVVILVLHLVDFGTSNKSQLLLRFWALPQAGLEPVYRNLFDRMLSKYKMIAMRSARLGEFIELSFRVTLNDPGQEQAFISELSALEGIERVNLFIGEENPDVW